MIRSTDRNWVSKKVWFLFNNFIWSDGVETKSVEVDGRIEQIGYENRSDQIKCVVLVVVEISFFD